MLELPESDALARQCNEVLAGKRIIASEVNHSPHSFAWYFGDPAAYGELLNGKRIGISRPVGGFLEIDAGETQLLFNDGVRIRYLPAGEKLPAKHQLYLRLEDGSALICTVQMYGGMYAYPAHTNDNPYYRIAREKPSPLTDSFDANYFQSLFSGESGKLSLKAFLATKQRIPGLGNGVLQDILFFSGLHPKRSIGSLSITEREILFHTLKDVLAEMARQGGRDTESDLFGRPGGYHTALSQKTLASPCPRCGGSIQKQSYLGGSIYFCPHCQSNP